MGTMASQITSLTIFYSTLYSGTDQRKHQSSESLAFVWGIHRGPVNSPHKGPVMRKIFPFGDVIMEWCNPGTRNFTCFVGSIDLTHCVLVMPCSDMDLNQHCLGWWLVAGWPQTITWTYVNLSSTGLVVFTDSLWHSMTATSFTRSAYKI